MAASHTPGPWRWVEDRMNGGWAGLVGPDGQEVMFPAHRNEGDDGDAWFEPGESVSEANARLIAAAPCLLAALRDLLCETGSIVTACPDIHRARKAAEAAIAKATGVTGG